jgi:MoaA/NifB/PqqE/SkfB family radical SAM enzyme
MNLFKRIKSDLVFSKNILSSAFDRLKYPYKLTFAVTSKCNLKCTTCCVWKRKPANELSYEEIDRFFRVNNFFNWIDITGGEIFLRKDLLEITKSIKENVKNLVMLHYPTNGFLTERIVETTEKIASLDFDNLVLSVSIDGNKEIHNKIRNNENAFQGGIETYKELRKNKHIKVYIGCTLSLFNIDNFSNYFAELKDYIPNLKYSDIHLNIYHYSENLYSNEKLSFDKNKCINLVDDFIKKKGIVFLNPIVLLEYVYLKKIKSYLLTNQSPFKCKSGKISCFIDPLGNVYPCSGYTVIMGSLRKNDYNLLRILSNQDAVLLHEKIKNGKCPHCWTPCEAYQNILSNLFIGRKLNGIN